MEGAGDIGSRRMKWRVSRSSTCPGGSAAESSRNPPSTTPSPHAGSPSSWLKLPSPRRVFPVTSNSCRFDARDLCSSNCSIRFLQPSPNIRLVRIFLLLHLPSFPSSVFPFKSSPTITIVSKFEQFLSLSRRYSIQSVESGVKVFRISARVVFFFRVAMHANGRRNGELNFHY